MESVWKLNPIDKDLVNDLAIDLDLPTAIASLFVSRGLDTPEKIKDFCHLDIRRLHNPFKLPDIKPAIERINKAIDEQEPMFVWGDYDVDGVTATAVVVTALLKMGANIQYHVPHRIEDGYDIKPQSIDKVLMSGATLLLTVDCGILAFEAADYAKQNNLDLIITDHHTPDASGKLPEAIAVINPNRQDSEYPFSGLAGVGIAFKIMMALAAKRGIDTNALILDLIEYVALGTVADVAPMIDENRSLVHIGCNKLSNSDKPGIVELLKVADAKNVTTNTIGFALGPRINAIGRLGDSRVALDLLLEKSERRAKYLANILDTANQQRQKQQEQIVKEALAKVGNPEDKKIIVVWAKGWAKGLVGLVAGKLAESYGRPALCVTVSDCGKHARGSCRSAGDFNILEALISPGCKELFTKVGGHAFAAGFDLPAENLPLLDERLNEFARDYVPARVIHVDTRVFASDISVGTANHISKIAPFGNSNPEPIFLVKNMVVKTIDTLSHGKHLKMSLVGVKSQDARPIEAVAWRFGHLKEDFPEGSMIDAVFKMSMQEYRGRRTLTMTIEDFRHSEAKN